MPMDRTEPEDQEWAAAASGAIPAGTPDWITPELVRLTQEVWQPHYKAPLTIREAVTILMSAGRLLRVFSQE